MCGTNFSTTIPQKIDEVEQKNKNHETRKKEQIRIFFDVYPGIHVHGFHAGQ